MDLALKDRIVLVVGASRGIGAAIVRTFAEEGASLVIMARQAADLERVAAGVREAPGTPVAAVAGDATSARDVERAVALAVERGGLDAAVLAAGAGRRGRLDELSDEHWRQSYELNLLSAVRLARAAAPRLRARNGSLVFLAAASGKEPSPGQHASNASKAALINLTRSLAGELAPEVRVNAVCPGRVLTPQWERKAAEEAAALGVPAGARLDAAAAATDLKRMGTPEEVAALVVFLASARASFITGQSISVDGGLVKGLG